MEKTGRWIKATKELPVTHGVITMSKQDHSGYDERGRVLVTIHADNWKLVE